MRVVSLLPSATEIVYALGLSDDLVGVTFECDEPPTARLDKTVVVGGRDTKAMTPAAIGQSAVVAQHLPGVPVWAIDADGLVVRPGPRLVDGVEAIAAILHPNLVPNPPAGRIARIA